MKIAVDYDGTISEDVEAWYSAMEVLRNAGHDVFIVTFRDKEHDWNDDLEFFYEENYEVYCTGGVAKRWWCEQFGPGDVDVWIDDTPEAIIANSVFPRDKLALWREENARVAA